tara:strand:+ start:1572 stop:2162 length:591 start_codon:yes stop_codon:yes gene_type:complete
MPNLDVITKRISQAIDLKSRILEEHELLTELSNLVDSCLSALNAGGKIAFCGNGGSFADAQHLSAEFTSRFIFDRPALASIALGTNSSAMSAIGNDYGFENIFAREVEANLDKNDVLIAITTSGNSNNIIQALKAAKKSGIRAFVFTGKSGGALPKNIPAIKIPSNDTARIQENHILFGHILCELVEEGMFGNKTI